MRRLISLRPGGGRRAGALQEYETFAQRLRRDLNVEPMPETVAVYESIVRSAGRGSAASISDGARTSGAAVLPFVGREVELARLRQVWLRAMRGFGAELYEERLAKIPDGPWRAAYCELPFNRHIQEAGAADSDADRTGRAYVPKRDAFDASN